MHNIQVVDDFVRKTEELFEKFFGDEDTAFIFSADHGMSNIGNHGDGSAFFKTSIFLLSLVADLTCLKTQTVLAHRS